MQQTASQPISRSNTGSAGVPQAYFIRNHSSSELHQADLASLPALSTRPAFANKGEYARWCHDSGTDHVFYVLAEPEHPRIRSSGANPIRRLHGLVADYDGDAGAILAALPQLRFSAGKAPTWVTTTFSGKARLIWAFEQPVPVFSPDVHGRFISILVKELKLKSLLPGLDEGALTNPHTPFELGTDWRQPYGDVRIPHNVLMLALHEASSRAKWKVEGPDVPMEVVADEVERRWPGRWVGPFEDGARGVRFWDEKADNPTGCTIRKQGVQAWTGEQRFRSWRELFGVEFVRKYQADRIGAATAGTYYDGQSYWTREEGGVWRDWSAEALRRHLAVIHGLSNESKPGQPSETAQALTTVERCQRVDGAFPCLFMREAVVRDGRHTYLNIARARPVPGAGRPVAWGEGFPWLGEYLSSLFDEEQREVFLSWLAHFYNNAVAGAPRKGHALFIAGPQSAGKTFLSQRVIGGLMGGFQEATGYVLGFSTFNEQLFYAPVWAVDDAVAASDGKRHMAYSQMVKKIVANPYQEFHAKFKKAVTHRFNGRLVVTLNDDPSSIRMLPQVEGSILDKMVILRARASDTSFTGADAKAEAELSSFAGFLARYEIPERLKSRPPEVARFGHDAWHHPDLLATARESSASNGLYELLDMWRTYYFRGNDKPQWSGSATELLAEMMDMDRVKELVRTVAPSQFVLGRDLQNLVTQGVPWISFERVANKRTYTILRDEGVIAR